MSELPEIKIMRRQIARSVLGKKISGFNIGKLKLKDSSLGEFKKKIVASYIKKMYPIGELFILKLVSGYYIAVNMQSTGYFVYVPPSKQKDYNPKHIRAEFIFTGGVKLFFIDTRGFSYFKLFNQKQFNQAGLKFAIDPMSEKFTWSVFSKMLSRRTTGVRNFLINDDVFLGIGNVYADEICFQARIHPGKSIKILRSSERRRIFTAIGKILRKSMGYDGLALYLPESHKKLRFDHFLRVYNKEGEKCYRCKTGRIVREKVGASWAHYCPMCQNRPQGYKIQGYKETEKKQ